jgi:hypothetical protein
MSYDDYDDDFDLDEPYEGEDTFLDIAVMGAIAIVAIGLAVWLI